MNVVILIGTLSSPPVERTLPSGDRLVTYEVTTRTDAGTESVPVTWFEPPASATAVGEGEEVVVTGRVRRRFFQAGGATQSRTEVVADKVVPLRQAKRARVATDTAIDALARGLGDRFP